MISDALSRQISEVICSKSPPDHNEHRPKSNKVSLMVYSDCCSGDFSTDLPSRQAYLPQALTICILIPYYLLLLGLRKLELHNAYVPVESLNF
jgi:hypothetical protein